MSNVSPYLQDSTNPFCLNQNSPWLLFVSQSLFFAILLSLNLYFWKIGGFSINFHILIIIPSSSTLCLVNFYFIDLIKKAYKKYEILYMMLFIVFFIFVISEALIFISLFWTAIHIFSPAFVRAGFFCPDPCQLPYSNTILLIHAACVFGVACVGLEISCSFEKYFSTLTLAFAWVFISLQIYVFWIMGILLISSIYGSATYFFYGLHFWHVIVGMVKCWHLTLSVALLKRLLHNSKINNRHTSTL